MNSIEKDLIKEVKEQYSNQLFFECIGNVYRLDQNRSIICHQTLQMYKTMSFFQLGLFKQAYQNFNSITEERQKLKGNRVDSIDVMTQVLCLIETHYSNVSKSEIINENLMKLCEDYRDQNIMSESYEVGVYLSGRGVYQFIKTNREEKKDPTLISDLEKACELLDEYKNDIICFLSWIYHQEKRLDEAEKLGQQLYSLNPKYPGISTIMAMIKKEKSIQSEEVIKLYEEAVLLCPSCHVVLHNIAYYYGQLGDYQKEEEYYKRSYEIQPRTAQSCAQYGRILYRKNQKEEANKIFNEGISIDPEYLDNYSELGDIANDEQDEENAVKYMKKCVELSPEEGCEYFRLAKTLQTYSKYTEAIKYYKLSMQKPNYKIIKAQSNSYLATCFYYLYEFLKSLEEFFNTLSIESSDQDYESDAKSISIIINNNYITLNEIVEVINKQYGKSVHYFDQISKNLNDKNIKQLLLFKLDKLRETLQIIVYKKQIQDHLTFQSQYQHFDLFLD